MSLASDSQDRALRILFLAPQPFFEVRGTPLAVLAMVRALTQIGHAVELLTYPQGQPVEVHGVLHRRCLGVPLGRVRPGFSPAKMVQDVPFIAEAWWRMATGRYDVVHAVEEAAHVAAPLARLLGLPLIVDVDSSIPEQLSQFALARGPLRWLAKTLERHALRRAAAVITVCSSLTDAVREVAPAATVFQVEDPPLVDSSAPAAAAVEGLRVSLGLGRFRVVLYSGNLEPYQGVDLLVEAAAEVREAHFVFMGGETQEIETLRRRAARIGVTEQCVFAGKRPLADLPLFLALADVVVSPRRRGINTPFKVYTYLAAGKPLVATRIPTHTQLLDDTQAFLVDVSAAGLASGLRAALRDPTEAAARAARGKDLLEREYSSARYLEKLKRAYDHVMATLARAERG